MAAGKFGNYKPKQLGAEPAEVPIEDARESAATSLKKTASRDGAVLAELRRLKVPYSSRITVAADQQLKALAKQGHSQVDLLAEALNLLFKKHKIDEVA